MKGFHSTPSVELSLSWFYLIALAPCQHSSKAVTLRARSSRSKLGTYRLSIAVDDQRSNVWPTLVDHRFHRGTRFTNRVYRRWHHKAQ